MQLPASILNVPTSDVLADADLESKDVTLGWVDVVDLVPVVPGVRPDVAAHPGLAAPHTTAPINVTANTARRIRLTSRIEVVPL